MQSLNVRVRPLLLDLPGYDKLRAVYRWLNTRCSSRPSRLDNQELASLQDQFMRTNVRSAVEFGLDLTAWTTQVDEIRF